MEKRRRQQSISQMAKTELCEGTMTDCCMTAVLSAIVHTAGLINFSSSGMSVIVESELKPLFPLVSDLTQQLFGGQARQDGSRIFLEGDFAADMLLQLRILRIRDGLKVEEGINPSLIGDECCKKAYMRGAFLGAGSLTTSGGYHLEFRCASRKHRDDLIKLLEQFELRAGATARGDIFVAYLKDKDMVCDALALMGSTKTCLKLNSLLAERSLKQSASRVANCDMANLNRLVSASVNQCESIRRLGRIKNAKLRETAEARLKYPDLSYEELGEVLGISKGAVKYRLGRIIHMSGEKV